MKPLGFFTFSLAPRVSADEEKLDVSPRLILFILYTKACLDVFTTPRI